MINKHTILSFSLMLIIINVFGQGYVQKSRVYLDEKQNQSARSIPVLLLDAYSRGDIKAYYPMSPKVSVPYTQFLNHFGRVAEAYQTINNYYPSGFCREPEIIAVDTELLKCMEHNFEIGEQEFRNNVTYQQEKKLVYIKIIYSGECAVNGLEKEGPVFMMKDIRQLKSSKNYKLRNPENPSFDYAIADYLLLRPFRAVPKKR